MTYFLDTNIISYIIKGNSEIRTKTAKLIANGHEVKIPVVACNWGKYKTSKVLEFCSKTWLC